uniref:Uncharacterized protein n=1 Tax=Pristionchus pacificus TaxID=54126 RepID=A0A2A6CHF7_PRIPA|eukprot:PDM77664.1 hypothetical protein PRIPAC_34531 [Pristionchus pacificus]
MFSWLSERIGVNAKQRKKEMRAIHDKAISKAFGNLLPGNQQELLGYSHALSQESNSETNMLKFGMGLKAHDAETLFQKRFSDRFEGRPKLPSCHSDAVSEAADSNE